MTTTKTERDLTYTERLIIRRALEYYAIKGNCSDQAFLVGAHAKQDLADVERLFWLFKDAPAIRVTE